MKKIILAVLALVILGGGGFGAYMFLNKPDTSLEEAVAAKVEQEEETHKNSTEIFVHLDPIYIPVIDKNGIRKMVSMVVSLEMKNFSHAERARALRPKLASYMLQDMYGVFGQQTRRGNAMVKTSMIKTRLGYVSKKILGPEAVVGVKLQAVTQRKV